MDSREYHDECERIAKDAVRDADGDRNTAVEDIDSTVDSHSWIIYTGRNLDVLQHSRNCDAYFEEHGSLEADGYSDAMAKMAYAAMRADVMAELEHFLEARVSDDDIESLAQDCARDAYESGETDPWGKDEPLPSFASERLLALVDEPTEAQRKTFDAAFREHHSDTIEANEP